MNQKIPEILFGTSDNKQNTLQKTWREQGLIRKVAPRIYCTRPEDEWPVLIRRNWGRIIDNLFPDALLSHRSALEFAPDAQDIIHLTAGTNREVTYPGLTLSFQRGPSPLSDDPSFLSSLHTSSLSRALLENLRPLRGRNRRRLISRDVLEQKLEEILHLEGEGKINGIRDRAGEIATIFGWTREYEILNGIIGALLGTWTAKTLDTEVAKARASGFPYDGRCLERLNVLMSHIKSTNIPPGRTLEESPKDFRQKAFFESYFSNYIEGTTFRIEEAEEIVFDGKVPKNRPRDAHDITGTFKIVSDRNEMSKTPADTIELLDLLKQRHKIMMAGREEIAPGEFKSQPNRAGQTEFVHPDYLVGTLEQGFPLYLTLRKGIERAVFMMVFISELHPFNDGNGRVARIMMNAELVSSGLSTIIIPTVFREDYLKTLRAFSRRNRPSPVLRMLLEAWSFDSGIDFGDYPESLKILTERNWFLEPDEGRIVTSS